MFVKEITLDGFKSYSIRTEIKGFDKHFNAITGLNGSGKSNILDAICFVLGITNLANIRVNSLQDLIYKSGTGGVTRASVSITFDNRDKKASPLGYESYQEITVTRQVAVGGKTKYLINGCNSQNSRVADLFCSVQLNVNNPHFLIMQGKITKILSMKPCEILGMLEEAAGTRMYDSKKEQVLKLIEKKDAKLNEIDDMIHNDIEPTIAKLKEEKAAYLELQSIDLEIKHLEKICVAFDYTRLIEKRENFNSEIDMMKYKMSVFQTENEKTAAQLVQLNANLQKAMQSQLSDEAFKDAERALTAAQKKEAKFESDLHHAKLLLEKDQFRQTELNNQRNEIQSTINDRVKSAQCMELNICALRAECEQCDKNLRNAERALEAIRSGLLVEGDEAISASELLIRVRDEENRAITEHEQLKRRVCHLKTELSKRGNPHASDGLELRNQLELCEKTLKKLNLELDNLKFDPSDEQRMFDERDRLSSQYDHLRNQQSRILDEFSYRNPEHNFDRNRVLGEVSRLFTVKEFSKFSTAVEVAAGSRLTNVVVEDVQTAKLLLERGDLKRRTTFIPLNHIQYHSQIDDNVLQTAVNLVGQNRVWPAISLLDFDVRIRKVMEFVFGNKFICINLDVAKAVAFHPKINRCAVTLEGDQFDPAGILTGGARQISSGILSRSQQWQEMQKELFKIHEEVEQLNKKIEQQRQTCEKFNKLRNQIMLEEANYSSLKLKVDQSDFGMVLKLRNELNECEKALINAEHNVKVCKTQVQKAEERLKKNDGEEERAQAELNLKNAKNYASKKNEELQEMEQKVNGIRLEIDDLREESNQIESQISSCENDIRYALEKLETMQAEQNAIAAEVKMCSDKLEELRKLNMVYVQNVAAINASIQELENLCNKNDLLAKELELNIKAKDEERININSKVSELLANNPWIEYEESSFGKKNSSYDFSIINITDSRKRLKVITERHTKLARTVNVHAMQLLNEKVDRYNELVKKRKIVFDDKTKIQATIAEWDNLKRDALNSAWSKVNEDFGSIFNTLLPGSKAKLSPPENRNMIEAGLEIKVAFGDQWKESLTELSGGQRSLAALSLILALLRYKPAPIYIMDEVDAALDMSHTQNIGLMIKKFFQKSQFIIVSLKDGMFNNANVLFKTQFSDNMSVVTRYEATRRSSV